MADGTSFGTSDVDQWKVFQADVDLEDCNNSKCLGYDTSEKFVESSEDPLDKYINGRPGKNGSTGSSPGEQLNVPKGDWKSPNYVVDESLWVKPGSTTHQEGVPWWKSRKEMASDTWIWYGKYDDKNGDTKNWRTVNMALFRFEFQCDDDYCNTEDDWGDVLLVDAEPACLKENSKAAIFIYRVDIGGANDSRRNYEYIQLGYRI